jgi:hypothetical protein
LEAVNGRQPDSVVATWQSPTPSGGPMAKKAKKAAKKAKKAAKKK